ncbi:4-(cytidine 5'-diphospho)-2-C-methyl-D-erythritol kinase [bacterium]|nr:4-(cytidine 5'-diphospho)-2-C-methyl-D-erythritol kinase [bacterium]
MRVLTLHAPAKVNLFLEIIGKRDDGYHELKTVMHTLDLADTLKLSERRRGIRITCNHPDVPTDERNLVFQAAQLLADKFGVLPNVGIHIQKRIPVAAGMGGGSSDAAAALIGLSRFWSGKQPKMLLNVAKQLGSDVPFFLAQGCALGLGRGEKIRPWPACPGIHLVVVNPGFSVSTAAVYKKFNLRLTRKKACINMMRLAVKEKNAGKIGRYLFNHLESVTEKMHPEITEIKADLLRLGAAGVLMAGSGATVFGLVRSGTAARKIAQQLKQRYPTVIATQTSASI